MELGTSSAECKQLQKDMNTLFGAKRVPEDGAFDEGTEHYLKILQKQLGVSETGKADKKTLRAIDNALLPRTKVVVGGKTYHVTKAELEAMEKAAIEKAVKSVNKFVVMAKEAEGYWKFHKDLKDKNWFSGIVDTYAGAEFPPKSEIDAAKKAADSMLADAKKGVSFNVKQRSKPIETALKNIQKYRNALYDGGDDLIKKLELTRDTCEITVGVLAAVSTGGATWYVQVGVSAGVGAYKGVLGEMKKAKDHDVTFEDIKGAAMKGAVIEGTVGLIMKGGGGVSGFADDVAAEAVKQVGTGTAKQAAKTYAINYANGAGQKVVEETLKLYVETRLDPSKKVTKEDLVKIAAGSVVSGGLKTASPILDKYAKGAAKQFKADDFLEVTDKARQEAMYKAGLEKIIESAGEPAVNAVIKKFDTKKTDKQLESELRDKIQKDKKVQKKVKELKKQK